MDRLGERIGDLAHRMDLGLFELRSEMQRGFTRIEQRVGQVDRRLERTAYRWQLEEVDRRFSEVERQIAEVQRQIDVIDKS